MNRINRDPCSRFILAGHKWKLPLMIASRNLMYLKVKAQNWPLTRDLEAVKGSLPPGLN